MTEPLVDSDGGVTVIGPASLAPPADAAASAAPLMTQAAAQAELRRMLEDRASPLYRADHAEHAAATQRFAMLSAVARGQQPAESVAPAGGMIDGDTSPEMLAAAAAEDAPPPADPSGYALSKVNIPDAPPGGQRDEAEDRRWMTEMRATAHAVGLNTLQWDGLVQAYNEATRIPPERAFGHRAQVMVGLQRVWGADHDRNLAAARAAVRAIEAERPGFVEWLEGTGMGDSPAMIQLALKVARKRGLVK